ncbi:MAG: hypothetical protein KKE86_00600 [Planctomycetes bacterium]|nr:hypothetical protein [Planctomycetota bacterium]MBU4397809.1 hypothetical protein [Planctomycetota bacterium]MCG2684466.1 hypothetical protein [Planctomycetales bacterium]
MFYRNSASTGLWAVRWLAAAVVLAAMASTAWAEEPSITRIEEDWELVIGEPSPNSDAPQVTCAVSPLSDMNSYSATFVVNHHEAPAFAAGGLQLQAWNGETLLASRRAPNQAVLATPGETIRWTQVMKKTADGVEFEVLNGSSTTWGGFGGEGTLKLPIAAPIPNLNGYNPENSVEHSGVSYAGNRVQSLVLKRVRAYTDEGLLAEDANPRIVHSTSE